MFFLPVAKSEYNHEEPCSDCGELKLIVHRDDARALCKACADSTAECCGKIRPCPSVDSETPRCETLLRRREMFHLWRRANCQLWTADGKTTLPRNAARRREHCHRYNNEAPVKARTEMANPSCGTWVDPRSSDDWTCGAATGDFCSSFASGALQQPALEESLRDGDGVRTQMLTGLGRLPADPACLLEWLEALCRTASPQLR